MSSLFEVFEVHRLSEPLFSIAGHPIAFTNSARSMFAGVVVSAAFMFFAMAPRAVIPGRIQLLAEKLYDLVAGMVVGNAGEDAKPFFPLVFSIFMYLFIGNFLGLIPGVFGVTSHVIVNFALAIVLFSVIIVTGFVKHGLHFFMLFVPKGTPIAVAPVLAFIEFFSFSVRPFSLSLRLFGNMLAGHLVLGVFAGFIASLALSGWLAGLSVVPLVADMAIIGFEVFVAFLQAYIYSILASVYLRDAIEMH